MKINGGTADNFLRSAAEWELDAARALANRDMRAHATFKRLAEQNRIDAQKCES